MERFGIDHLGIGEHSIIAHIAYCRRDGDPAGEIRVDASIQYQLLMTTVQTRLLAASASGARPVRLLPRDFFSIPPHYIIYTAAAAAEKAYQSGSGDRVI